MSSTWKSQTGADPAPMSMLNNNTLIAHGTTVPADGTVGYHTGCLFIHTDGGGGTALYVNEGSTTSSDFNPLAGSTGQVAVGDANYTVLAANSGKPHIVANVSADRTFTLPSPAAGLDFEFIADVSAADGHDWIFTTGSDTNFFTGGVVHLDNDAVAAGIEVVVVGSDGNSNSKLQVNLPNAGTSVRFISNGTTWNVSGFAVSTTAPTFADQ